jgi:hypothetical protein
MKNTLLLTLCIANLAYVHAQETAVNVSYRDLISYGAARNGESHYAAYMRSSDKKDSSVAVLNFYDRNFQLVKQAELDMPSSTHVAGIGYSGDFTLLAMADPAKQTRTLVLLDREGHVMHRSEETSIKSAVLAPEYYPSIYTIEPNTFVLVRLAGAKKNGYEVEVRDQELNTRWIKTFVPDEGVWSVVDTRAFLDKVFILRKEKKEKNTYSVQCINIASSKEMYNTDLRQGAELCYPSFIRVSEGTVLTGGLYAKEGRSAQNGDGVFFAKIDAEGKPMLILNPWEITKQLKGDAAAALASGKTKVFIEDIAENKSNPGEHILVGEEISQSGDVSKSITFSVSDMLLFRLNREGLLTAIDRVDKKKREAVIKNVNVEKDAVAEWLFKKRFFPYGGIIENGPTQMVMYKNDEGEITKAYFRPIDSVKMVTNLDISRPSPEDKQGGANAYVFDMAADAPQPLRDAIPGSQGQVLLYDSGSSVFRMSVQQVPERNENRNEGSNEGKNENNR